MPTDALYMISSGGTVLSGITYKLRKGEKLKAHEWFVLSISLATWGAVSFGLLGFYFADGVHVEVRAATAILLGVGLSETYSFVIAALQAMIESLPESVRSILNRRFGGPK